MTETRSTPPPNPAKNFFVFTRVPNQPCRIEFVAGSTVREAFANYIHGRQDGEVRDDGTVISKAGDTYSNLLAFVEAIYKTLDRRYDENEIDHNKDYYLGSSWEIDVILERYIEPLYEDCMSSMNPYDLVTYFENCRKLFHKTHPRSRARGFIWYLRDGVLVSFYEPLAKEPRSPIRILARYLMDYNFRSTQKVVISDWHGSNDGILDQMRRDNAG